MPPTDFQPADPAYAERVRASFARQAAMGTIGAELARVEAGEVEVQLAWAAQLTQQHGFLHGGILGAALDSACGYAASTLMPADVGVLRKPLEQGAIVAALRRALAGTRELAGA